jgi:hypothetical protein
MPRAFDINLCFQQGDHLARGSAPPVGCGMAMPPAWAAAAAWSFLGLATSFATLEAPAFSAAKMGQERGSRS